MPLPQLVDIEYDEFVGDASRGRVGGLLFMIDGKEVWLPAAAVEVDIDSKTITMPRAMAYNKGLI